jgi:two-component sensor histidine kinase
VVSRADESSPHGRAFSTGEPSICNVLRNENKFVLPPFYAAHNIVSTIDVVIKGVDRPYGVLEIDSDTLQDYDEQDIVFLTAFANVLAEAVATSERIAILKATIEEMDRLLGQKKVMAEELQHRVRNNLQLISGMLNKQLKDTSDPNGKRGINGIVRRVSTLAQVYDHLIGSEMTRTTDFGGYVMSLCLSLADIRTVPGDGVTLNCHCETLILDLDVVTALGIAVTELITNAYDHAFPGGTGAISVSVRRDAGDADRGTITISDDGPGFTPGAQDKRHGLGLVRRLVEQVSGTATVETNGGTVWTIGFPLVNAQ